MTMPADRIRALKLDSDDIGDGDRMCETAFIYARDAADKQYTKLLTGLAEILEEHNKGLPSYADHYILSDVAGVLREVLAPSGKKAKQLSNVNDCSAASES